MSKITTSYIRQQMPLWLAPHESYFKEFFKGYDDCDFCVDKMINGKWLRETKARVLNSVWIEKEDFEEILQSKKIYAGDFGYINKDFIENNKFNIGNCWHRVFSEPDGGYDNFRMEIYTDPTDTHVIYWEVIVD